MKKIFALILAGVTLLSVSACRKSAENEPNKDGIVGGWTEKNEELSEEELAIFNDATQYVCDVSLEPIKLIGTQVVAGLNYKFLCSATDEAGEHKVVVTVYHDLQGNNSVTSIEDAE